MQNPGSSPQEPPSRRPVWDIIPRHARVVVPTFLLGMGGSGSLCVMVLLKTMEFSQWTSFVVLWAMIITGPFASIWALPNEPLGWTMVWGGFSLVAILAHPILPNLITAAITTLAVTWWFMWGVMFSFSGV